jgi:hypothetical protein
MYIRTNISEKLAAFIFRLLVENLELLYNRETSLEIFRQVMVKYAQCCVEIHEERFSH